MVWSSYNKYILLKNEIAYSGSYQAVCPYKQTLYINDLKHITFDYIDKVMGNYNTYVSVVKGHIGSDQINSNANQFRKISIRDFILSKNRTLYLKCEHTDPGLVHFQEFRDNIINSLNHGLNIDTDVCKSWSFWVGFASTLTPLHYDHEEYSFLYVIHGCKRVIFVNEKDIPSEYKNSQTCSSEYERVYKACWYDIDIFSSDQANCNCIF